MENEKDNRMSFLDLNIIHEQGKFTTSAYRKPTFSGIYTNFGCFFNLVPRAILKKYFSYSLPLIANRCTGARTTVSYHPPTKMA